jgi:hypothetical protein
MISKDYRSSGRKKWGNYSFILTKVHGGHFLEEAEGHWGPAGASLPLTNMYLRVVWFVYVYGRGGVA